MKWITEVMADNARRKQKQFLQTIQKVNMEHKNEMPRRNRLDANFPAEISIQEAMDEVEKLDANVHLTEAVKLLAAAKDKVADYFDAYVVNR